MSDNQTLSAVEEFVLRTETKLMLQQGQIELIMSLLAKKVGKQEFMDHLRFAVSSPGFGKEAKYAAAEILRQDALWPHESLSGLKQ